MAILIRDQYQGSHWYTSAGEPAHQQFKKSGDGMRPTTIRDARKYHLIPSVTQVLGIMDKPGLNSWKVTQAVMATLQWPRLPNESEDAWCKRVIAMSREQVVQAADLGTEIHDALEKATNGDPYKDELRVYVQPVLDWIQEKEITFVEREKIVVSKEHGYAGTADVFFRFGNEGRGILDYKTRKTIKGKPVQKYDGQGQQLAAYAATYWGERNLKEVLAANVIISTTEPGRIEVIKHENLEDDFHAFLCCCDLWRYQKGYDPRG